MAALVCLCGASFANAGGLSRHADISGHHFRCVCGALFDTRTRFKVHRQTCTRCRPDHGTLATKKTPAVVLKCPNCEKNAFKTQDALQQHIKTKHPTARKKQCEFCPKSSFKDDKALQDHTDSKHPVTPKHPVAPIKKHCDFCGKSSFNDDEALQQHIEAKHPIALMKECNLCHKAAFKDEEALQEHIDTKHPHVVKKACTLRGKGSFKDDSALRQHMDDNHPPPKGPACSFCDESPFQDEEALFEHVAASHWPKHFCLWCPLDEFESTSQLARHILRNHPECPVCSALVLTEDGAIDSLRREAVTHQRDSGHCHGGLHIEVSTDSLQYNIQLVVGWEEGSLVYTCTVCNQRFAADIPPEAHLDDSDTNVSDDGGIALT